MLVLRSLIFNTVFYLNLVIWLIVALPCFLLPRRVLYRMGAAWARCNIRLMRVIVGTKVEFRGIEHIPEGGLLVAAKHQSFWETFALLPLFADAAFVLKKELTWIPLFGWYALKTKMVPVDRDGGISAVKAMTAKAREAVDAGRQLVIFPEGTRRAPGAPPDYKSGTGHLYRRLNKPCLPIALNSGLFWPRRQFMRYPGTIIVEILPPIPPGLSQNEFSEKLQGAIEHASDRLCSEGLKSREVA